MARSEWVCDDAWRVILALLTPENELAVEVSLRYGMRIGDVLAIKVAQVRKRYGFTYKEEKTGKRRKVVFSADLRWRLLDIAGRVYVFEHRTDWTRHRTRQAVYRDIRRAAVALRIDCNVTAHSARKAYAVRSLRRYGSVARVQRLLNHSDEAVTMLYALADVLTERSHKKQE